MICVLRGHGYEHEIQTITQIFFPNRGFVREGDIPEKGYCCESGLGNEGAKSVCTGRLFFDREPLCEKTLYADASDGKRVRNALMNSLFLALREHTGAKCPWGSLTGIRPSKLVRSYLEKGMTEIEIEREMRERYFVSEEKARLCIAAAKKSVGIIDGMLPDGISVYIGIPFCPSACLYCSFTSYSIKAMEGYIKPYFDALYRELDSVGRLAAGRRIECVYVGGGTPASVDADLLAKLLEYIRVNLKPAKELDFEAGRPDSLDERKLKVFREYGVNRISVNPQTMNDATLRRIGRGHTASDIEKAFYAARDAGHNNINMDVITGLPGETADDVAATMERIAALGPESATVHTLAVKNASKLRETLGEHELAGFAEMEAMLKAGAAGCRSMGMEPYYLYRQKNMLGNFENAGYCKSGYESVYNVYIMEETQTILSAGAAAVTKIVSGDRIERVFNVKNLDEYISRIDEMISRKEEKFYALSNA